MLRWKDESEIVGGCIITGKIPSETVDPRIFMPPYDKAIKYFQKGIETPEALTSKVGIMAVQTMLKAAESVNGVADIADLTRTLEITARKYNVGKRITRTGERLQRGDDIDLDVVINDLDRLNETGKSKLTRVLDIKAGEVPLTTTGWKAIDYHLGGIPELGLTVLLGDAAHGKTSALIKLATCFVQEHEEKTVAIFTLEMVNEEFVGRLIEINSTLTDQQKGRIYVQDRIMSINEIINEAATLENVGLVGVDFADYAIDGEINEPAMSSFYRTIARAAKNLYIPFVILSQPAGNYEGGIPRPQHTRYTRLTKGLAWMILSVWNPVNDYYSDKETMVEILEDHAYLVCWKMRGGFSRGLGIKHQSPGAIALRWRGDRSWHNGPGTWFSLRE